MILVYNFLQIILLIMTLPVLAAIVLGRKKYRGRMAQRLGFRLPALPEPPPSGGRVIWVHALSVGEVTSALPLVRGIRQEMKDDIIIFSASTGTGMQTALKLISPFADHIVPGPVDLLFSVNRFIRTIRPDLFILVETDFWPNWLHSLWRRQVPMILVNGRISGRSFARYRRFSFFFTPLFRLFSLLSMQTGRDADQMAALGVPREKITALGNLKYDTALMIDDAGSTLQKTDFGLSSDRLIWVCGSTHRGEEEMLLNAFAILHSKHHGLALIIAPRDPGRSSEITDLADGMRLQTSRRTFREDVNAPVLILDTIGELTGCYKLARVALIGGSLVSCGGHNPLEASVFGVPVLFGPHMDDFAEIARDCIHYSAGREVSSTDDIVRAVDALLLDDRLNDEMSRAAVRLVRDKSGVVRRHLEEIRKMLPVAGG
jgi:3-deoxy-D-manno-octulosonic-acid transferase